VGGRHLDWDEKLSIARSSVRTIISRLGPSHRLYIGLYDVIIASFYIAFLLSLFLLVVYAYYFITHPVVAGAEIGRVLQQGPLAGCVEFFHDATYTVKGIAKTLVGVGEPISRIDLLILMGTTLSVTAGFYGVATQLYSGEWGGWITFRRAFVYVRRTPSPCRDRKESPYKPISVEYAERLLDALFPTRRYLFALSYDQVIIAALLLSVLHFVGVVAMGTSAALASALELLIFSFILGGSLLLVILSLIIRPPLAVFVAQLGVRGPLLYYKPQKGCVPAELGLRSLMVRRVFFRLFTVTIILAAFFFYLVNPIQATRTTPVQLAAGLILYLATTIGLAVLLGIVNEEPVHRIIRFIVSLRHSASRQLSRLASIIASAFNKVLGIFSLRVSERTIYELLVAVLLLAFALSPILLFSYVYIRRVQLGELVSNVILLTIVKILILLAFAVPVLYLAHILLSRRKGHMDFSFYVRYAEQILELLKSGSGQGPPRPILLLEILAVETMLAYMVLVSAVMKTFEERLFTASTMPPSWEPPTTYKSLLADLRDEKLYRPPVEWDPRFWMEPRESSSRFFTPMGDLESYYTHVDNLVSFALSTGSRGMWREYLEGLLVLSILMGALGLIGSARMGRIRSSTYPRALFHVTMLLLRTRRTMEGVDEKVIQEIESVIPDLLATLVIVTRLYPSSVCQAENLENVARCFARSLRLQDRHYCCQIITLTLLPCLEDKEVQSRYPDPATIIFENCPGILENPYRPS